MSVFIKNVEIKNNVLLAPMAGYTDFAFRKMCHDFGAGLTCTEMVSASALHYHNKKTEDLLYSLEDEHPIAVQLFGHNPDILAEAVKNPLIQKFDVIDLNMGCPAPKITSNGDGSALLKNFDLAEKIIKSCVESTEKPVTVKFRIGYNDGENVAVEFAKICERAGASALTVHGRTTKQGYSGAVDYETIKQVKNSVSIPVFANGDCKSKEDFDEILRKTNADGVMIGRASLGCPEIFGTISGEFNFSSNKLEQILFHYETLLKVFPENLVVKNMRAHLAFYLKGKYKNTKALLDLLKLDKFDEIKAYLVKLFGLFCEK